jgi:ACS family glucarate transporter-like MFS transporter
MSPPNQNKTNRRYILIVILFFHTVKTYMDRICISAASTAIQNDLGITNQMMGYIFGIFALGYALFQIPSGWFADTFGPKKALAWVVSAWSTFTALTAAAWNGVSILIIRFLFGMGEAGAFPGATRAIYNWVPQKERGLANGLFHSGARLGSAFSLLFMPFLIRLVGWRLTFIINGLIGILWTIIWITWFKNHPREHPGVNDKEREYIEKDLENEIEESQKIPFGIIVTSPNMLLAMIQYMASNITFFIALTWLLPYMVSQWGQAAEIYAPIPLIVGMFAHWSAGGLITWLHVRGYKIASRKIPAIFGFFLGIVGLLLATQVSPVSPLAFILTFSIAVFGVEMTIAPSWTFCMDVGGVKSGAVSGTMNMLGNIGSAVSAIIFPYFVANVTLPVFAKTSGTANSFFIFAATINLVAILAWIKMNPAKQLNDSLSPSQIRFRVSVLISAAVLLILGLLIYKTFLMK